MDTQADAARLLVRCLEAEGVEYVFGIPGEENIHFINLQLGVADATTNSTPVVAISAQVGLDRIYKESHQIVDLVSLFRPITKWAELAPTAEALPEMVRKAFKTAQTERPGAVYLAIPEDVEAAKVDETLRPLPVNVVHPQEPSPAQVARAADVIAPSRQPIVLAGHGATRDRASHELIRFSERLGLPVATTFNGKGVFPDDHPNALGAVGFMRRDYVNFGFDEADVLICVGYELQEFDPVKINPNGDKKIIHIHRSPAEVDDHYPVEVGIQGDISHSLRALADAVHRRFDRGDTGEKIRRMVREELEQGRAEDRFPLSPRRIITDIRAAMRRDDIVLADTGAVKMWMARMYPTYEPNTLLVSNGLSSMGFSVPSGAVSSATRTEGHRITAADELLPTLRKALDVDTVSVIAVPVDYSENLVLTSKLGELTGPF
jgi:acetolactate synthase-1/2/3 large subunit